MDARRIRSVAIIVGILFLVRVLTAEVICDKGPRLKPLRCVCGSFTNAIGEPVSDVVVMVLIDGNELARVRTGQDGKFRFGELKPGKYNLSAEPSGYLPFRSAIVVAKPTNRCKCTLTIRLETGGLESCGSRVIRR